MRDYSLYFSIAWMYELFQISGSIVRGTSTYALIQWVIGRCDIALVHHSSAMASGKLCLLVRIIS
jgi:hypothetical protein